MSKRYAIRPVYSDICGLGYELVRLHWFWRSHVQYEWLKYNKESLANLKEIVAHLGGTLVSK